MKRVLISSSFLVLAAMLIQCAPAQAAQGGGNRRQDPIKFILDHATDLTLTDDQKTKIEGIQKDVQAARPKDRTADRTEYMAKVKDAQEKVAAILTKEQQDKLTALKDKAAPGAGKDAPPKDPAK